MSPTKRLLLALMISSGCLFADQLPTYPTMAVTVGSGTMADGRMLVARDNRAAIVESANELGYQKISMELQIPKPGKMPDGVDLARVCLAITGDKPHPVNVWMYYPKSFAWQKLEPHFLPTKKDGFLIVMIDDPARSLTEDLVRIRVEIKDPKRPADPFSIHLDSVLLQVGTPVDDEPDLHAQAARASGKDFVRVRVHEFAGKSSGRYEAHIRRMWRSWDKSMGVSARTILQRKKDKQSAPIYTPGPYYGYGNADAQERTGDRQSE